MIVLGCARFCGWEKFFEEGFVKDAGSWRVCKLVDDDCKSLILLMNLQFLVYRKNGFRLDCKAFLSWKIF